MGSDDPFVGIEPKHGRKKEDPKHGEKTRMFSGLNGQISEQVGRADPQKDIKKTAMNRLIPEPKVKFDGLVGIQDRMTAEQKAGIPLMDLTDQGFPDPRVPNPDNESPQQKEQGYPPHPS